MPMYDYLCTACEHEFELLQAISDPPPQNCPKCERETIKKKIVAPSFTFKGGGWYKDLYSTQSSDKAPSGESTKTESAPAAKETAAPAKDAEAKAST